MYYPKHVSFNHVEEGDDNNESWLSSFQSEIQDIRKEMEDEAMLELERVKSKILAMREEKKRRLRQLEEEKRKESDSAKKEEETDVEIPIVGDTDESENDVMDRLSTELKIQVESVNNYARKICFEDIILNIAYGMARKTAPPSLDETNSVNDMVTAGSECSFINLSQKKACLREQIVEAKEEKKKKGKLFILCSYFSYPH
jgi:hypothetical protein